MYVCIYIYQLEAATFRTVLSTGDEPYLTEHQNAVQEFLANTQHLHKGNPEGRDARTNQTRMEDEGEPHGWSAMILDDLGRHRRRVGPQRLARDSQVLAHR